MKLSRVLEVAHRFSRPYRVTDGARFRLKDVDPADTGDLKSEDKPRAKEALATFAWGRFDVSIDSDDPRLAVIAYFINRRSRLSGIATGDQAIFVRRDAFPGFPPIALMEDVAFSRLMKQVSPPACLTARALTSARRWEAHGVARTVLLMWRLRYDYWRGADPDELARRYSH